MTLALALTQFLPPEIQLIIARNLNAAIDTYRSESKRNRKVPISVNPLQVIGLFKASNRLRWYDPNQPLFRAYNFMGTLPEPYLVNFATNIIVTAKSIHHSQGLLIYPPDSKITMPAVVSILQSQGIAFEEREDGFRLVDQALGAGAKYIRPGSR